MVEDRKITMRIFDRISFIDIIMSRYSSHIRITFEINNIYIIDKFSGIIRYQTTSNDYITLNINQIVK